jgi:hypothetical protein
MAQGISNMFILPKYVSFCLIIGILFSAGCTNERIKTKEENDNCYRYLAYQCKGIDVAKLIGYRTLKCFKEDYFSNDQIANLAQAAKEGDVELIDKYLSEGVDINTSGTYGITPLMYSMTGNSITGFNYLLQKGADPNKQTKIGESAISFAARRRESEHLKKLISFHGNPNIRSYPEKEGFSGDDHPTPIFQSILAHNQENAVILIKAGADLEEINSSGLTPLMSACVHRSFIVMHVLLEAGANIRATDNFGYSVGYYIMDSTVDHESEEGKAKKKCIVFMENNRIDLQAELKKIEARDRQRENNNRNEPGWAGERQ